MTTTLQQGSSTIDQRVIHRGTSVLESANEVLQYLSTKSPSHLSNGQSMQKEFEEGAILTALDFIPGRARPQVRRMLSPHEAEVKPIAREFQDKVIQNLIAQAIVRIQASLWASQQGSQYQR